MSSAKEVRTKIKSIQNTQKITKAMEMVAASKMRRAQERIRQARPYSEKVRDVCAHLASSNSEYHHPFLMRREVANGGIIVVSSDKGLCGGLNTNAMRLSLVQLSGWATNNIGVKSTVLGGKGAAFLRRIKSNLISECVGFGDKPVLADLLSAASVMLEAYRKGEVDEVRLIYTRFINTVSQEAVCEQLLPIPEGSFEAKRRHSWDYIYEPEAPPVVDLLLTRYVEAVIYQAIADNIASEQAARMVAMKAASDNAGNLIDELQLVYNKSRQAAITQEIAEIVSGASAV